MSTAAEGSTRTIRGLGPGSLSGAVLLAGLVLTGALAWATSSIHDHNERRLLGLELHQAALVVSAAVPSIQIPLTSAAELAAATDGDAVSFRTYITPYVGGTGPFVSASLWRVADGAPTLVTTVGITPELVTSDRAARFLPEAPKSPPFAVINLLSESTPSIGYASTVTSAPWVVYAERALPADRKLNVTRNTAFSQLRYAIYLGRSTTPRNLLESESAGGVSQSGPRATVSVPFGNSAITLVATPNGELGGSLLAALPWLVGGLGIILAVAAATVVAYLGRRRRQAEVLAAENRRMYSEQRSIAEVLQAALIPQELPAIAGVETAARYVSGGPGTEVGGDWYDLIPLDETHFFFVLGDVSGRGVGAATIVARLHFAIRAYAVQGDAPDAILRKLGRLLSIERDRCFATVLCALVDVVDHTVTLVNAGHPPLLLLNGKVSHFIETTVFPPVGAQESTDYRSVHVSLPPQATIVAFTDGLIERRGESIDSGLERLVGIAADQPMRLDDLLTRFLNEAMAADYHDDTAILAVRWKS